jgi:perosamine synthetase
MRIVVLGSSGRLGSYLFPFLRSSGHEVLSLSRRAGDDLQADLTDPGQVELALDKVRPDSIVNLAAETNIDACEECPQNAYFANVKIVENLVKWIEGNGNSSHLVQLSTDHVYDGLGPHAEDDISPLNYYGFTKYAGELLATKVNSTILRTNFFGRTQVPGKMSYSDWLMDSLTKGKKITVFDDVYFSPLSLQRLTALLELVVVKRERGIFNLGSKEGMSKADFSFMLAKVLGLPTENMSRGNLHMVDLVACRAKDMRMNSSRFEKVYKVELPSLTHEIQSLVESVVSQSDCKTPSGRKTLMAAPIMHENKLALFGGKPVREKLLPYGRQFVDQKDIDAVVKVLRSDWLTTGPSVVAFEQQFSKQVGADHGVAVSSGTAALHCAVHAAGIKPGDEVITSPITFMATANCIRYQEGKVVFADVDPDTLNIDPEKIKECLTSKTRAIIAVDYTGLPADLEAIGKIAQDNNLVFIEDAAHALGATYKNRPVGSIADMTTFSLHPVKNITTGEGGVVVTSNSKFAESLRQFRNHGIIHQIQKQGTLSYDMEEIGYNYRLTEMNSVLGISQLQKLSTLMTRRRKVVDQYDDAFSKVPQLNLPARHPDCESAWHLYVIKLKLDTLKTGRDEIFQALRAENIGVSLHYIPVPWLAYYKNLGYKKGSWPIAERTYHSLISLPLWPGMKDLDVEQVVVAVKKVLAAYQK